MRVIALRIRLDRLSKYMHFKVEPSEFLNPMVIKTKYFNAEKIS